MWPIRQITRNKLFSGLISGLDEIIQVVSGDDYSLALSAAGEVYFFGLYFTDILQVVNTPTLIPELKNIIWVSSSSDHFLALTIDGHVYGSGSGAGSNQSYKLLQPDDQKGYLPTRIL